ncbi:DUF2202 domain-containing protein [Spirochaeta cellobiosiphila]|uniref:DUF2202 domain-containing protein n=1 Tax=Spirochaeta cellobiosiphila TaxID=504483 RepID=UPI0003FA3DD8|nr:DUF2202 domain-containing protein [Spirochaeta cellobiosiphila]
MKNKLLILAALMSMSMMVFAEVGSQTDYTISEEESSDLTLLREEEKLARDVYSFLYDKWGMRIFHNISQSEQNHMEQIGQLLIRYDISDPIVEDIPGIFQDESLQSLYDELTQKGSESLGAALYIGASIEDLDISDLQLALKRTQKEDISFVYDNLTKGSRNHMRSFYKLLEREQLTYNPQYISNEDYRNIITTPKERGRG